MSLATRELNKLLLYLIDQKSKLGSGSGKTNRIQHELAKVKLSLYENDYNTMKQERAISQLEEMINENEIKDPALLSDSYLKLSKWHFDYKDMQIKHHQVMHSMIERASAAHIQAPLNGQDFDKTIRYCKKATEVVKTNNEAWHYYSQMSYEASKFYSRMFSQSIQESEQEAQNAKAADL